LQVSPKLAATLLVIAVVVSLVLILSFPGSITALLLFLAVVVSVIYSQRTRRLSASAQLTVDIAERSRNIDAPGSGYPNLEPSPPPTPKDIQIQITREIGGQLSTFNVNLNDLLIAPYGIVQLLNDYQSHQTEEKWNAIKERARQNQNNLQNLYAALEELKGINFFGMHPEIANEIEQIIQAKMHRFYGELNRHLSNPRLTKQADIDHLRERARELDASNTNIKNIQTAISAYIGQNWDYLQKLLSTTEESKEKRNQLRGQESRVLLIGRKNIQKE
jgi:hypothetical protein